MLPCATKVGIGEILDRQKLLAILAEIPVFGRSGFVDNFDCPIDDSVKPAQTTSLPFSLHLFDTLPSTNQKLWQLLEQGAKPGTVVIATEQTAGQGQWGRQWSSPTGGLYLSMALAPNLPAQQSHELTLSSAWGIATTLRDRGIPVSLKWPNDLILNQRKLGGILTQTKVRQGKIALAVVGVGINWTNQVPPTGINLQSFAANQTSAAITCIEMLAAVTILGIASGHQLCSQAGIDTLLDSYHQLLTSIGKQVWVDGRAGVVVGVTASGNLRVVLATNILSEYTELEEIHLKPGEITIGYDH